MPPLGKPAPLFTLADVALQWAQFQRGHALPKDALTLIVYQGSAEEVTAPARRCALDPAQTILLPDADRRVTEALYPPIDVLNRRAAKMRREN